MQFSVYYLAVAIFAVFAPVAALPAPLSPVAVEINLQARGTYETGGENAVAIDGQVLPVKEKRDPYGRGSPACKEVIIDGKLVHVLGKRGAYGRGENAGVVDGRIVPSGSKEDRKKPRC
ncbi:hypothetical protein MAPG_08415 [Magnaporthiopsis poae ATCC 64411]|uniref:Uncharacterized protein n=1 Tax=Magnaporthiopsis poae (strain ATCC 64411 / 73-15) TaxID=644358 RepID=A0A0C4E7A9_MAGP6|nr:hypothetical protein MAPG_08415 [Magnaporthiopsis poae ATCC 64411]